MVIMLGNSSLTTTPTDPLNDIGAWSRALAAALRDVPPF